ncbi:MAG TPA: hypothetical protein VFO93_18125 [Hymenobacter sp.]|uniref:hypothetical protein n=1 Tax=Hymenobacter sp. TaxID=1898978 RepID=UPI002D7FE002|nr:hypothetical protein [Hymenobacter sp.]HET9505466.1 hypothetical protein [Hymenobacter sp.]
MELANNFCGIEFDWFAIDVTGAIGLFSTGGWGPIPKEVLWHAEQHQQLSNQFALPNAGTLAIWDDFARYGLYVFDWKPYEGPYLRVAQPLAKPDGGIKQTILTLPDLLLLPVSFHEAKYIIIKYFNLLH